MSALVETAGTAFALSGLAAVCLALLPQAPPRLRFAVAVAGLAAWLIPWGAIHVALPAATFALPFPTPWADAFVIGVQPTPPSIEPPLAAGTLLAFALTAASLLGAV